jgi:hypothetical protein
MQQSFFKFDTSALAIWVDEISALASASGKAAFVFQEKNWRFTFTAGGSGIQPLCISATRQPSGSRSQLGAVK